MADELMIGNKGELVSVIGQKGIEDLLQPLIREIHLFDSFVAGTTHLKDPSVLKEIREGDRLTLQREENKFDDKAILVLTADRKKLGYIPEKDNLIFSRLMDAGKKLTAKISSVEQRGNFTRIAIGIYLVDF